MKSVLSFGRVALVLAVCFAVSVAPAGRGSVVGWMPTWYGWYIRDRNSRAWVRPLHLATATTGVQPVLPSWLAGLTIITNPTGTTAAIADRTANTLTAIVSCTGAGFGLRSASEMDWLLTGWGKVFDAPNTAITSSLAERLNSPRRKISLLINKIPTIAPLTTTKIISDTMISTKVNAARVD